LISLTKDLTPKDNKESPLRELDWQDDDYAMEVVSGRIYDRDLPELLGNLALLNDRGGATTYMPSMAEAGEHNVRIALPGTIIHAMDIIADESGYELSDVARISLLHGMSMYEFKLGSELEKSYYSNAKKIKNQDKKQLSKIGMSVDFSYKFVYYQLRVDGRVYHLVQKWAAHAGLNKMNLLGMCILYSLRTHIELKGWFETIDEILKDGEMSVTLKKDVML
jgi:hypothetical protein